MLKHGTGKHAILLEREIAQSFAKLLAAYVSILLGVLTLAVDRVRGVRQPFVEKNKSFDREGSGLLDELFQ